MNRFNMKDGKMIYDLNGDYIYQNIHDNIINKLHETFNLQGIKIPEVNVYFVILRKNKQFDMVINSEITDDVENINNGFVKFSEHKYIVDMIENQIFNNQ